MAHLSYDAKNDADLQAKNDSLFMRIMAYLAKLQKVNSTKNANNKKTT